MPVIQQNFGKIKSEAREWPSAEIEWWTIEEYLSTSSDPDMRYGKHYDKKYDIMVMNSYGEQTDVPLNSLYMHNRSTNEYGVYPILSEHPDTFVYHWNRLQNLVIHNQNMLEKKGVGENLIDSMLRLPLSWLPKYQKLAFQNAISDVLINSDTVYNKARQIESFFLEHHFLVGRARVRFLDMDKINEIIANNGYVIQPIKTD